jgi:recombination protein RecR
MNPAYTQSLNKLIEELAKLPGIGTKTAERLAFHILRTEKNEAILLADAITKLKNSIKQCKQCHNLSESDLCSICRDTKRDKSIIWLSSSSRTLSHWKRRAFANGFITFSGDISLRWTGLSRRI